MVAVPQFRAKEIDSDEYVVGYYAKGFIIEDIDIDFEKRVFQITKAHVVDKSTLSVSFNGIEKWFDIKRVNEIMLNQVNCKTCNDTGINHHNQPKPNKYKSIPCNCKIGIQK
jgi:formate dehydrogenase assembly factor FdhD